MKRFKILQAAVLVVVIAVLSGCSSGRYYQSYPPPPPRTSVSLILNGGPGIIVSRYPDGRYYYRNPQGMIYWRGYGNRYYLDRQYINRGYYQHSQYRDWKRYHGRR